MKSGLLYANSFLTVAQLGSLPKMTMMAYMTVSTPCGGLENDLSSANLFLSNLASSSSAYYRAGNADYKSALASSLIMLISFCSFST